MIVIMFSHGRNITNETGGVQCKNQSANAARLSETISILVNASARAPPASTCYVIWRPD